MWLDDRVPHLKLANRIKIAVLCSLLGGPIGALGLMTGVALGAIAANPNEAGSTLSGFAAAIPQFLLVGTTAGLIPATLSGTAYAFLPV